MNINFMIFYNCKSVVYKKVCIISLAKIFLKEMDIYYIQICEYRITSNSAE